METESGGDDGRARRLLIPGRVVSPLGLAGITVFAASLAVLAWPNQADDTFVRAVGAGIALLAGSGLALGPTRSRRSWASTMAAIAVIGVGLAAAGNDAVETLGRALGTAAVVLGAVGLGVGLRRSNAQRVAWSLVTIGAGIVTFDGPRPMLSLLVGLLALGVALASIVVVGSVVDGRREATPTLAEVGELVSAWLLHRPSAARDRNEVRSNCCSTVATPRADSCASPCSW